MPNVYLTSALKSVIDDERDSNYDLEDLEEDEYPSDSDVLVEEMIRDEYREQVREVRGGHSG